ncbi:hypothetical protein F5Y16DRAFT_270826 [Xylariaceae sp. FL0255]|nr:hypothetical protein F5Y16DRAFT_270826 [Xylariaceae sp. FL0255]
MSFLKYFVVLELFYLSLNFHWYPKTFQMELDSIQLQPVKALRMSGKPERPYVLSLKSHPSREAMEARRKPLRTYSKRTSSTESTEPVAKRRRIDPSPSIPTGRKPSTSPITSDRESQTKKALPNSAASLPPPPKKGTIMAYFGKATPKIKIDTSSAEPSSDIADQSTPPSSPPPIAMKRRKVRRLTTRFARQYENEIENGIGAVSDNEENEAATKPAAFQETTMGILSESTPATLNQTAKSAPNKRSESGKRGKSGQNRTSVVQTTLSLSLNEKGYTECKDCDMLYNPLHEPDVKHHARRHAALQRAKDRAKAYGSIDDK